MTYVFYCVILSVTVFHIWRNRTRYSESANQSAVNAALERRFDMARRTFDRSTSATGNLVDMNTGKLVEKPPIPVICDRIKKYREAAGIEQKELARKLNITANSISNWETGRARPDINLIPGICELLHVTLYELFDMDDPSRKYTEWEQTHMDRFCQLEQRYQYVVDQLTCSLLDAQMIENCPAIVELPLYERSLAAGIGDPSTLEENTTPLYLYSSGLVERADCVFSVNGNSMEPEYHNGDLVLVKRMTSANALSEGETGAFLIGNETYIKNLGPDGLESLNPDYETIHFTGTDIYLIGKVIGILEDDDIADDDDVALFRRVHGK